MILFLIRIPDVYDKSRSLYAGASVFPSKWSYFYSYPTLWVSTLECRPACPLGGGGLRGGVDLNG